VLLEILLRSGAAVSCPLSFPLAMRLQPFPAFLLTKNRNQPSSAEEQAQERRSADAAKNFRLNEKMSRGITPEGRIGSQRRVPFELEKHVLKTS